MSLDPTHTWSARDRLGLQAHRDLIQPRPPDPAVDAAGEEDFGKVIADAAGVEAPAQEENFFGEDGLDFGDFLDLINPLQHLPVISTIYRDLTGDEISTGSRIFGGALFGGPVGLASAVLNSAVEEVSGKDIGALAMSLFESDKAPETAIADASEEQTQPSDVSDEGLLEAGAPDSTDVTAQAAQPAESEADPDSGGEDGWMSRMPELSEDQVALLLSSLGLPPEAEPASSPSEASDATAQSVASVSPASGDETSLTSEAPNAPTAVFEAAPSPDASVAEAMERALDKYEATFGQPTNRGARYDDDV